MARNSFLALIYQGDFNSPIPKRTFFGGRGKILERQTCPQCGRGDFFGLRHRGVATFFRWTPKKSGARGRGGQVANQDAAWSYGDCASRIPDCRPTFLACTQKKSLFQRPKKPKKSRRATRRAAGGNSILRRGLRSGGLIEAVARQLAPGRAGRRREGEHAKQEGHRLAQQEHGREQKNDLNHMHAGPLAADLVEHMRST